MVHRHPRLRPHHALCVLILLIFALSGGLAWLGGWSPVATAQIGANQPTQPFASVVSCIRPGTELGGAAHDSPRFATTCFGTKVSPGGYTSSRRQPGRRPQRCGRA